MKLLRMWTAMFLLCCLGGTAWAQAPVTENSLGIDWPLQDDPKLVTVSPVPSFHPRLASLWMQALNQPDSQTRYEAAAAIAEARSQGMEGLEMTIHRLGQIAGSDHEHPMARQAALKALIALNAEEQAQVLMQAAKDLGPEVILLTDPALARWKHAPAIGAWEKRLEDPQASITLRRSAAHSLAEAQAKAAAPALAQVAQNTQAALALRLDAARAYARLAEGTAAPKVKSAADARGIDALVAVYLLLPHTGEVAVKQLVAYAGHSDPAIATIAAEKLLASQPALLDALVGRYVSSGDARLRAIAIERMLQRRQTTDIQTLDKLLADVNPQVGRAARAAMVSLARDASLKEAVTSALAQTMNGGNAAAVAHAALAAGELDLDQLADTLVKLLDHKDESVGLAAATALRKLQVESTLQPVMAQVDAHIAKGVQAPQSEEAAQLIMLLGLMKHQPAREMLVKLVRKNAGPSISRQAAIWSLGKMLQGQTDNKLAGQLASRVNDVDSMNPEDDFVRLQAIIALGRLKARNRLAMLQTLSDESGGTIHGAAARWAIGQITGQTPPDPQPGENRLNDWFLVPLD